MTYTDTSAGTPVSLIVTPAQTTPPPPGAHPLPFTGFALVPVLAVALSLIVLGTFVLALSRRTTLWRSR